MIYCLIALLTFSTAVNGQDCGGDNTLGCMDDTECATFGAGITCDRAAPTDVLGCCNVPTTTTAAVTTVAAATTTTSCVDLLNPLTGVSDCPTRSNLCTDSVYLDVMRVQCPRTCNFCGNSTSTNSRKVMRVALLLVQSLFVEATAICFMHVTSSFPHAVISEQRADSESACKIGCLQNAQCTGLVFANSTNNCLLFGGTISASCSYPFEYWVKSTACSKYNVSADYVPDQCMTNALLQPQYLLDNAFKICPTYAVEGEAVARLYIISVIFPNGTYRAFANDQTMEMRWDQQKALYTIRYVNGGVTFFDEPIYAATCAFIKDDLSNACPCADLPTEPQTAADFTDVIPVRPYPLDACAGNYITRLLATKNNKLLTYSATTSMILHCRAGLWIQAAVPTATNYNSWEVSAGACYR